MVAALTPADRVDITSVLDSTADMLLPDAGRPSVGTVRNGGPLPGLAYRPNSVGSRIELTATDGMDGS
jgi:hypothetical protein